MRERDIKHKNKYVTKILFDILTIAKAKTVMHIVTERQQTSQYYVVNPNIQLDIIAQNDRSENK